MQHSRSRIAIDGAVAGILGAVVVAGWFLAFDSARGRPFETPALLAAAILHGVRSPVLHYGLFSLTVQYTAVHFLAFIAFGVLAAFLLEAAEREPTIAVSLAIFLAAFEVFFIAVVMLLGPAVMQALPWWAIVVGNLMAAAVMLAYFLYRHPVLGRNLFGPWIGVAREGVAAGLIGGVIVAACFLLIDLAAGQALRTPAMLGHALFYGTSTIQTPWDSLQTATVVASTVIVYTVIHFGAFIVFGIVLAVLMSATDREPMFALGVLVVFAMFEVCFLGLVTLIDASLLEVLGWWKIAVGNVLALAAMVAFFLRRHRGIVARLEQRWVRLEHDGEEHLTPQARGR